MDITLERILSLIPKKPDGKFVHGAKKDFCEQIGAPTNIVNEWIRGVSKSYRNYLFQISTAYNVSVEWLRGETDIKEKLPAEIDMELIENNEDIKEIITLLINRSAKLDREACERIKAHINFTIYEKEKRS